MKKTFALSAFSLALIAGFGHAAPLASGIVIQYIDPAVRPQDDLYRHANGKWLEAAVIPADRSEVGPFVDLDEKAQAQLRGIIEKAVAGGAARNADAQRIGDLYASFMDEARVEQLGLAPLKPELDRIAALKDRSELPALLAHLGRIGAGVPVNYGVGQDRKDATRYAAYIVQSGLSLPDADYYLKADDKKLADIKAGYQAHIAKLLAMAGSADAASTARAVVDFETALAKVQWTPTELRDPVRTYNKVMLADMDKVAPGFDWKTWLAASGITGRTDYVIVREPSYLKAFAGIANATPLETWKAYLIKNLIIGYSDYLPKNFVDANFDFFGKTLNGNEARSLRWKTGVNVIESSVGYALGKLYVAEYFPAERKARVEAMVDKLLEAYKQSVDKLDWMSPAARQEARAKLAKMRKKIGYPDKWEDYSALVIRRDDLVGNMMRVAVVSDDRGLNRLGKPVDHDKWEMTPQTINAYYSPQQNEVVFPAMMLQPPFFDANADDAANYGGIGAVIGHELSHGFDDQGSQFDADGNLRDWLTAEDHAKFKAKAAVVVKQYSAFEPLPGYHVNGELSLGENIADNAGLSIAYKAYHLSLKGKPALVIDGLTGDQRFYLGFGQIWRQKLRENFEIKILTTNEHAPGGVRANGTLRNQPGFYEAFGVKPGDRMYLAPRERVSIW